MIAPTRLLSRPKFAAVFIILAAVLIATPPSRAANAAAPTDDLLGFSRYLPDDCDGYVSLLKLGDLRRTIAASRAWQQLADAVVTSGAFAQLQDAWSAEKLPLETRAVVDLLGEAAESEVTFAVRPDVSRNILALGRVGMLSAAIFAPSRFELDSPQGFALEARRAPLRKDWAATLSTIQVPSFVVAARFHDPAKYDLPLRLLLNQAWKKSWTKGMAPPLPPGSQAAVDRALVHVTYGKTTLTRFHLRLGDVAPQDEIAKAFERLPIGDGERDALVNALANLTFNAHIGFVGDYFTLVVSSNDEFAMQIVERYEGRSQATLAASPAFEPIRAELTPNSIGILYGDSTESRRELRERFLPLLATLTEPAFLSLLGAPPQIGPTVERFRLLLETSTFAAPVRQHSVLTLDRGLRQVLRTEYDREPLPAAAVPLVTPNVVPATAIGFTSWRHVSFDGLWEELRWFIGQAEMQVVALSQAYADNPDVLEMLTRQNAKLDGLRKLIDDRLAPSLQGEAAVVLGGFVPFSADNPVMTVRDLPIPSVAVVVRSPAPDQAVDGLTDFYEGVMALFEREFGRDGPPVLLYAKQVDGLDVRTLRLRDFSVAGFEPHLCRVGDALVISTSYDLTKQIRDTSAGGPSILGTLAYQAVAEHLPPTANQLSYLDGALLNRSLHSTVAGLFANLDQDKLGLSDREREEIAAIKRYVELGLRIASTFRGTYASLVGEGRTDVLREWIHFEDLRP